MKAVTNLSVVSNCFLAISPSLPTRDCWLGSLATPSVPWQTWQLRTYTFCPVAGLPAGVSASLNPLLDACAARATVGVSDGRRLFAASGSGIRPQAVRRRLTLSKPSTDAATIRPPRENCAKGRIASPLPLYGAEAP